MCGWIIIKCEYYMTVFFNFISIDKREFIIHGHSKIHSLVRNDMDLNEHERLFNITLPDTN
jgi:hypothetical protein